MNWAAPAFRASRLADVAAVQNQPVMRVAFEFFWYQSLQTRLDLSDRFARSDFCPVRDSKNMGVDGDRLPAKGGVEHHIRCFSTDAR